jgi:hypothetical protein
MYQMRKECCAEMTERTDRGIISVKQEITLKRTWPRSGGYVDRRSLKTLNGAREAKETDGKVGGEEDHEGGEY